MNSGALERVPRGARVAIVRLRSMGDCVLTTPAFEILKNTRPDLEIGIVVEDRFRAIFEGNPAVSAILDPAFAAIWRWRPQLCLNLHGGRRSMFLTAGSRAKIRAGFAHHRGAFVYNVPIPRAQEILGVERPVHTAEHLASAMFYLGCPQQDIPRARLFAAPPPEAPPYAIFHPIAAAAYKTWPAQRFVQVAEHVRRSSKLEPVFIGAASDDLSPFRSFRVIAGAPLAEIMSLISGASLFFGNDSGPAHIAAAFGIPLVVLFGRMEHSITWAPWRATAAATLVNPKGIAVISVEESITCVERLHIAR
ncbi:MAG TPA: glycosyltransferase family 9 protein [Bryobacteraceae bacterium]|nr:glycosyltransferase family 9 protein [Bryobacteraceae bacterium]